MTMYQGQCNTKIDSLVRQRVAAIFITYCHPLQ
jgi:hypothetical protein